MAAPTIQNVGYNPLDPQGSATLGQAMLKAQLQQELAQKMMEQGSEQPDPNAYIPGNQYAPARVIAQNPLGSLARALQQGVGAYAQKEAMNRQLSLQQAMMQRQFGMMNDIMGGDQPSGQYPPGYTFPSKEAAESAPVSAGGFVSPDGKYGGNSGQKTPVSPGTAALKKAMLMSMMGASPDLVKGIVDYGSPTPDMKNADASGVSSPLAYESAKARNSAAANAGYDLTDVTSPDGTTTKMTREQAANMAAQPRTMPASTSTIATPPPATDPATEWAQANAGKSLSAATKPEDAAALSAASPITGPGFQVQSPAQAEGQKNDFKNATDYKNGLINQVSEGEKAQRIINAQEELLSKFKSGAWTTHKAELANMAASLGASPDLVKSIAGGDPAAVQAFEGMSAQHALLQLKSMMGPGSRVGQQEFIQFQNDLADPDKMAGAIRDINNLQREQYAASVKELGALTDWEKQGKPINMFRQNYAQTVSKELNKPPTDPQAQGQVKSLGGKNYVKINGQWFEQ